MYTGTPKAPIQSVQLVFEIKTRFSSQGEVKKKEKTREKGEN